MLRLVRVIDQALGYVAPFSNKPPDGDADNSGLEDFFPTTDGHAHAHAHDHAGHHHHSRPATRPADLSSLYRTTTVQEKWVDNVDEYREFDRKRWEAEGDVAIAEANERSKRQAERGEAEPAGEASMDGVEHE